MAHIDELAEPLAYEEGKTHGGQLNGRTREENIDGIAFAVAADGNSQCVLCDDKACQTTPIDKDETVTVIFDEIGCKVLAEEWEREATKLFPQHVLLPSVRWLSEGDAWHAEQGLAGFLGAFDVGDLEESFG